MVKERDDIPREIEAAATASYRGYLTETTEEDVTGGKLSHCTAVGRNGEVVSKIPMCRPYGFDSRPVANTELIFLETQAGLIVCCERYRRPAITDGQVIIYDQNGAEIRCTNNTGATRRVEIGKGGTMKDAARKGDPVNNGVAGGFDAFAAAVITDLAAIVANLALKQAGASAAPPVTTTWNPTDTIAEIEAGSATVGIED